MPATSQTLVIAAPETVDLAAPLAEALHQRGWMVARAITPAEVATFAAGQACAVVLASATRDDLVCARAAVERGFSRRIPVFAEPMVLPGGLWTTAPIPPRPASIM